MKLLILAKNRKLSISVLQRNYIISENVIKKHYINLLQTAINTLKFTC